MIAFVGQVFDWFFGAGEAAVTVPPLDGAFQPNTALDQATRLAEVAEADNLVSDGARVLLSSGCDLLELLPEGGTRKIESFAAPISSLASDGAGRLAIALEGEGLILRQAAGEQRVAGNEKGLGCVTAMAFAPDGQLYGVSGSARHLPADWARNLLERRFDGSAWVLDVQGKWRVLAEGLAWPAGVILHGGDVVTAEAWAHRLIAVPVVGGKPSVLIDNLPAYPGRIGTGSDGIWLCCFAPRSQLLEFVLREKAYRNRMMTEVAPEFWVAPALRSGKSFQEPLQGGAVKQLGVLKPWAPTRSYGLVVRLDEGFLPRQSLHSRADGSHHGITSSLRLQDRLVLTSRGGDAVLSVVLKGVQS